MTDLIDVLADLEDSDALHEARLMILLQAFADRGTGEIEGLTKLAKLDFLLRYPLLLERALRAKGRSVATVQVREHEKNSVESQMVRYRFGPWDHRYRRLLNQLVAKELATVRLDGKTIHISLTQRGRAFAESISARSEFVDVARRASALRTHFDLTATTLMRFIYDTFPELSSLRSNRAIDI